MNFMFIRARYNYIQLIILQRIEEKQSFYIHYHSRRVAMVWNDLQWYSYSLPCLLMQTFLNGYALNGSVLVGYVLKIRIGGICIGGIRLRLLLMHTFWMDTFAMDTYWWDTFGRDTFGMDMCGICMMCWICMGYVWWLVGYVLQPFEWIRIAWIRTGGIRMGGIRLEWICVGYVRCAGYVWDMCGGYVWNGYVWDMCDVLDMCGICVVLRYANNLLKNPATKRLSGIKKSEFLKKNERMKKLMFFPRVFRSSWFHHGFSIHPETHQPWWIRRASRPPRRCVWSGSRRCWSSQHATRFRGQVKVEVEGVEIHVP